MVKSKREREFLGEVLGQVLRDLFMKENPIILTLEKLKVV
jgi:hypothetical protein